MRTIEQIEKAVQGLSESELAQFRAWFVDFDQAAWDAELSRRAEMIRTSVLQHERGESRDGFQALAEMKQKISDRFGV